MISQSWLKYIKNIIKIYDDKIDFLEYYKVIHPDEDDKFPKACELHGEKEGHSLSYSRNKKIWSCFGACGVKGQGVVEYHYRYLRLKNSYVTYTYVLNDLKKLFYHLGLPSVLSPTEFNTNKTTKKINDDMYIKNIQNALSNLDKSRSLLNTNIDSVDKTDENINRDFFKIFTSGYVSRKRKSDEEDRLKLERGED